MSHTVTLRNPSGAGGASVFGANAICSQRLKPQFSKHLISRVDVVFKKRSLEKQRLRVLLDQSGVSLCNVSHT